MAAAEALKAIHGARNQVSDKVDGVQDTLKVVEDRMRARRGHVTERRWVHITRRRWPSNKGYWQ
jgi:hypothetical protein